MDPVTHMIAGALAAQVAAPDEHRLAFGLVGAGAAAVPDLDFILDLAPKRLFRRSLGEQMHRGLSHSLIALPLIALVAAAAGTVVFQVAFTTLFEACVLALISHLVLDFIVCSSGLKLFAPFYHKRFGVPLLLGVDLMSRTTQCARKSFLVCSRCALNTTVHSPVAYGFVIGFVAALIVPRQADLVAIMTFSGIGSYIVVVALCRNHGKRLTMRETVSDPPNRIGVYPKTWSGFSWHVVAAYPDRYGFFQVRLGKLQKIGDWSLSPESDLIVQSRATDSVQSFLHEAMWPYAKEERVNGGHLVVWTDLAYAFYANDSLYSARVCFDSARRVSAESFQKNSHQHATMAPSDNPSLEREAAAVLADTLAAALHLPGERERHRCQLARAICMAQEVVDNAKRGPEDSATVAAALFTLVKAHAARAQDARHGVGQLSQGSQRAPTRDDCDDGWRRVEAIAKVAEVAAIEATCLATQANTKAALKVARSAEAAAMDARRIVDQRNHAYTFHASPGFSFGEGWYVAAAATVAEVSIQVEPGKPQTAQAEQFLRDAGLGKRLVPYRSRPRSNKHLPEIIERAFRTAPNDAQRKLRAAFLGDAPIPKAIVDWCDGTLAAVPKGKKVLLWLRYAAYHPMRNTSYLELVQLVEQILALGLVPILIGDALRDGEAPLGTVDMTLFWKRPLFQGVNMRRAQLQLFEHLKGAHGLVGQVGVTTAGMDGPALMGLPTMYLTQEPNVRLGRWVGAVPGYQEIVRDDTSLMRISRTLEQWACPS